MKIHLKLFSLRVLTCLKESGVKCKKYKQAIVWLELIFILNVCIQFSNTHCIVIFIFNDFLYGINTASISLYLHATQKKNESNPKQRSTHILMEWNLFLKVFFLFVPRCYYWTNTYLCSSVLFYTARCRCLSREITLNCPDKVIVPACLPCVVGYRENITALD